MMKYKSRKENRAANGFKVKSKRNTPSSSASKLLEDSQVKEGPYKCLFCNVTYERANALGGHVSKRHANLSTSYQKKQ